MEEFVLENVSLVSIFAFILYSAALYQLTKVYKALTPDKGWWEKSEHAASTVFGGATGWAMFPWLMRTLGTGIEVPWDTGTILGIGSGAFAKVVYDIVKNWLDKKSGGGEE